MSVKRATIYKDYEGYIICPMSKTVAGFYVSTDPTIRIYNKDVQPKLAASLHEALMASKEKVATPQFGIALSEAKKLELKEEFKKLGIKSFASLDKKPFLSCDVKLEDSSISFTPLRHDLSKNGNGYTNTDHNPLQLRVGVPDAEIVKAIEETFSKCE